MNGPARRDWRPDGRGRGGRSFRLGSRLGSRLHFALSFFVTRRRGRGRGRFGLHDGLRLGLSVRDGRRFGVGWSAVLSGGFGFAAGRGFRILMPVIAAQLQHHVVFQRAGVRLFIRDAEFGEFFQYFVSLDFQLPRQLVNSDLSHR